MCFWKAALFFALIFVSSLDAADGLRVVCSLSEGPKWGSVLLCLTDGPWAQHSSLNVSVGGLGPAAVHAGL